MIDGRPACPSCGNAARQPVTCVACSRPTTRPARSAAAGGLICESCARQHTHATCRTCRRHRRVARRDDDGRPLCKACGADNPVTHECPDCGATQPGAGRTPCRPCALARRIAARAAALKVTFRQSWVGEVFVAFCVSIDAATAPGDMARRLAGHAKFFTVLDAQCAGTRELSQQRLLDVFGAEGLRRAMRPVRFLAGHLALPWDRDDGVADSDRRRVAATSAAAHGQSWAGDLAAYERHLAAGRKIAPATTRMYVASAAALLRTAGVECAAELTQAHVSRYLHRYRGRRTNIMRFLSWVSGVSGAGFDVGKVRRTRPRKREKKTLRKASGLLARLEAPRSQREGRALLAAAISVVHGVPMVKVLALRRDQVDAKDSRVILWEDEHAVELAALLRNAFDRYAAHGGYLAFPGPNGLQPLTTSAVRHHLDNHHRFAGVATARVVVGRAAASGEGAEKVSRPSVHLRRLAGAS